MGFDLVIQVRFFICENTGKLYYYQREGFDRIYGVPEMNIPEKWWKYIKLRGNIFQAYVEYFELRDKNSIDVSELNDNYPIWWDVRDSVDYEDGWEHEWTEKDHKEFREFIKWCSKQDIPFFVSWC